MHRLDSHVLIAVDVADHHAAGNGTGAGAGGRTGVGGRRSEPLRLRKRRPVRFRGELDRPGQVGRTIGAGLEEDIFGAGLAKLLEHFLFDEGAPFGTEAAMLAFALALPVSIALTRPVTGACMGTETKPPGSAIGSPRTTS